MSGWVFASSSAEDPHCEAPIPPHAAPACKDKEDSLRMANLREEGVEGPVEMSNDMELVYKIENDS